MKYWRNVFLFILFVLLFSYCSSNDPADSKLENENAEKKALKIVQTFDSTSINVFRDWGYYNRGENGFWYKNSGDSSLYRCIYLSKNSPNKLVVLNYEGFINDFKAAIPFDTSFWRITITKRKNHLVNVVGHRNGEKVVLVNNWSKILFSL